MTDFVRCSECHDMGVLEETWGVTHCDSAAGTEMRDEFEGAISRQLADLEKRLRADE